MYAVTGASGQLGSLVIDRLLAKAPADRIVAIVRRPEAAAPLAAKGVVVRQGDYDKPETLRAAVTGVETLLLISSSEVGKRVTQHQAAIDAAKAAGVKFVAYTSLLRADTSPLGLASEHRATEEALAASGLPHALLRNGWYVENYLGAVSAALEYGALLGAAGKGRISFALRADYADAAVAAITEPDKAAGKVYELAGDEAWTLADLVAEIGRQAGRTLAYKDMTETAYAAALAEIGLPEPMAGLIADADAGAADGALFDDGRALSALIGRPTTPIAQAVTAALAEQG